jgi:MFS family permease
MWKFKGIFTKEFNVVTLINFFLSMNFTTFFLFPLYIKNLGGTESDIGVIMGASGVSAILAIPLSGYLSDLRVPKKIMINIGIWLAVVASGTALLTTSLNVPLFAGIRLIQGISFSFSFMASSIFVAEIIPEKKRAQGIGMFGVFSLIPHALGPAIGEIILSKFDFSGVFAFSMLMGFAAFPLLFSMAEPKNEGDSTKKQGMLAIVKDREMVVISLSTLINAMGFSAALVFVPTFAKSLGLANVSVFFICYSIAAVSVRIFAGDLSDSLGRKKVIMPSMLLFSLSIIGIGAVWNTVGLAAVGLVFGASHGFLYPAMISHVIDSQAFENRGKSMSIFSLSFNIGTTVSAFACGFLAYGFGYRAMFFMVGGTLLACFAIFQKFFRG